MRPHRHTTRTKSFFWLNDLLALNLVVIPYTMKNLFYILGGGVALWLLTRYSLGKKLLFNFSGVRPKGKLTNPILEIQIAAQNPTNQRATINSISGTLYLDGKQISNISSFTQQMILPNSETILTIEARPGLLGIVNIISDVFGRNKSKNYTFRFSGSANVDNIVVPIDNEIVL